MTINTSNIEIKLKRKCPSLYQHFEVIKAFSKHFWEEVPSMLPHYTKHDLRHTDKILQYLDEIVPLTTPTLNPDELYVLLSSAYLHDISMQFPQYIFDNKNIVCLTEQNCETVRQKHRTIIEKVINIELFKYFKDEKQIDHFPYHSHILRICQQHNSCSHRGLDYLETISVIGGENIRIRLLTALIQCADALHISEDRIATQMDPKILPTKSQIYWWKNYYVREVLLDDRFNRISVHYVIPQNFMKHMEIFIKFAETNFRGFQGDALDVLWDHGIYLKIGGHAPWILVDKTKETMPLNIINKISTFISKNEKSHNAFISKSVKDSISEQVEKRIIEEIEKNGPITINMLDKIIKNYNKRYLTKICNTLEKKRAITTELRNNTKSYSITQAYCKSCEN